MKTSDISKENLIDLYETKKLTTFQIAEKFGCCQATIWKRLKKFGISSRLSGAKRVEVTKRTLQKFYLDKKFSTWKIERILKIPRGTIYRKLKNYGIPVRSLADANIRYTKTNFNGNDLERAYLIGFRIGDLRVRKQHKKSITICVACSSTIKEQIELIEKLFSKYGRVWVKTSKDKKIIHSEAYLNNSFQFLLPKKIPKTLLRIQRNFFSFLSGFTDAEGNIGIYNNLVRFSLGNYDIKLLEFIRKRLIMEGINCNNLVIDKRKGKLNNQGYPYRNNYCSLRVCKKEDLLKLFNKLKPFIKHGKKVKDLNNAIEIINSK